MMTADHAGARREIGSRRIASQANSSSHAPPHVSWAACTVRVKLNHLKVPKICVSGLCYMTLLLPSPSEITNYKARYSIW